MKFRLLILTDPDAKTRGYDLRGIRVPLTSFCPVRATPEVRTFDDQFVPNPYEEFWKVPTCLLVLAKPSLARHLKGIENMLIPVSWCDVAPTF